MSGHKVEYYNCGEHIYIQCRCPGWERDGKEKVITSIECPQPTHSWAIEEVKVSSTAIEIYTMEWHRCEGCKYIRFHDGITWDSMYGAGDGWVGYEYPCGCVRKVKQHHDL